MGTTISRLAYQIVADTQQFTKGMTLSRKELSETKRIMRETQTPVEKMGHEIDRAGVLFRKGAISQETYTRRVKQLRDAHQGATPVASKFGSSLTAINPALLATAAATAGVASAMMITKRAIDITTQAVKEQLTEIDEIAKSARTVGSTSRELVGLRMAAAEFSGISGSQMDLALKTMNVNLGDAARGTGEAKTALDMLGVTLADVRGADTAETFRNFADQISAIEDPTQRAYIAQKIFGRGGKDLINTLAAGGASIAAVQREAERLGLTFSEIDGQQIELANDSMGRLKSSFTGAARSLTVELAPSLIAITQMLTELSIAARVTFGEFSDAGNDVSAVTELVAITADWFQAVKLVGQAMLLTSKLSTDFASGRVFTAPRDVIAETKFLAKELWGDLTGESWGEEIRRRAAENSRNLRAGLNHGLMPDVELPDVSLPDTTGPARNPIAEYLQQLAGEARAVRMTADQLKLYDLAQQGASRSTIANVAVVQRHVREMQRLQSMREDAAKLVKGLETPEQKYATTFEKLTEMYRNHMLTLDEFTQLKRNAADELSKPITITLGSVGIEGARAGSQAARLQLEADRQRIGAQQLAARQKTKQDEAAKRIEADVNAKFNERDKAKELEFWARMDRNLEIIANSPQAVLIEASI